MAKGALAPLIKYMESNQMELVILFIEKLIQLENDPKILIELDTQLARAQRKLEEDQDGSNVSVSV